MIDKALVLLAATSQVVAAAAASAAVAPMKPLRQPSQPWGVDFAEERCVVTRGYGTADQRLTLALNPSPFAGATRLLVLEQGKAAQTGAQHRATVQINDLPAVKTNLLSYGRGKMRIVTVAVPTFTPKAEISSIRIKGAWIDEGFATPGLPAALAMMHECLTDLQRYWNADAKRGERIVEAAQPLKPLASFFSPADYPADAFRELKSGRVRFSLLVDEAGAVRDCSAFESSGTASLDTMSCYILTKHARFRPALGVGGKPVKSAYCQQIIWAMDPDAAQRLSSRSAKERLAEAAGQPPGCGMPN